MTGSRFLLDTHVLLWAMDDDQRLSVHHREILMRGEDLIISVVSIWEIAIKRSMGKLKVKGDLLEPIRARRIPLLPINEHHALFVERLDHHHRDPFDRLLIAQAKVEGFTIMTTDRHFARYDVALA